MSIKLARYSNLAAPYSSEFYVSVPNFGFCDPT